jgi:hypothetical protein
MPLSPRTTSSSTLSILHAADSPAPYEVTEVGFTGDILITKWPSGTRIDDPDGSAPTWKKTSNPDHPAAYVKGSNITMFAKITINPSLSEPKIADLRVKSGGTTIAIKLGVTLSGSSVTVTGITTTSALSNDVQKTTPSFTWELSLDNAVTWQEIGTSGPHTLYWTYGGAWTPPFADGFGNTYAPIYDKALEKSCGKVSASSNIDTIITQISQGVDADLTYNWIQGFGGHPLNAYNTAGGCECRHHAFLLAGLLNTIGILGIPLWVFGGRNSGVRTRYNFGNARPTFYIVRGAHDATPANPHFHYHVVVIYGYDSGPDETLYDPSYGTKYLRSQLRASIPEVYQGAPGGVADVYMVKPAPGEEFLTWPCPHNP